MSVFAPLPAAPSRAASVRKTAAYRPAPLRSTRHRHRLTPFTFSTAPMFVSVLAFALGDLAASKFWRPPGVFLLACVVACFVTLAAVRHAPRVAFLPLVFVWALLGLFAASVQSMPDQQLALRSYGDLLQRRVTGHILRTQSKPATLDGESVAEVDVAVDHVENISAAESVMAPVTGGLRLTVYQSASSPSLDVRCGDSVALNVRMRETDRYYDPGAWDYSAYLLQQGIGVHGSARPDAITQLGAPRQFSFSCYTHAAHEWASQRLHTMARRSAGARWLPETLRLTTADAGLLAAMVFGDRAYLDHNLRDHLSRTGAFHLMVVSGLHLSLIAGAVFWTARRIRLHQPQATFLAVGVAFPYALLTGFGAPVQRSLLLTAVYLCVRLLYRQRAALNGIAISALVLLLCKPASLFDSSFQMTFLAVIAIGGIAAPLFERRIRPLIQSTHALRLLELDPHLPPRVAQFRVSLRMLSSALRPLLGRKLSNVIPPFVARLILHAYESVLLMLLIELAMALPMAVYFHRVTIFALPVNLLTIPLLAVLLPSALVTFLLAVCSPAAAMLPSSVVALLLHSMLAVVRMFGALRSADLRTPAPPQYVASFVLLTVLIALWTAGLNRRAAVGGVLAVIAAAALTLAPFPPLIHRGSLEVTAIDVGQGDSMFLTSPDGRTMLVDAGGPTGAAGGNAENASTTSAFDVGEDVVSPYLWSRGVRRLDVVALTHAHSDHMGGMPAVLRNFRPRELWVGNNPPDPAYNSLLADAASLGITVRSFHAGQEIPFGSAQVHVLAPEADFRPHDTPNNNDSLVIRIVYHETSALLEGDAEWPSEHQMVTNGGLSSTLLKVGHHGSNTSTTWPFLNAVTPHYAVISDGRHNSFGHPRFEVLAKLARSPIRVYRTDTLGASTFLLDGTQISTLPTGLNPKPRN